jgi:hypothetical protein
VTCGVKMISLSSAGQLEDVALTDSKFHPRRAAGAARCAGPGRRSRPRITVPAQDGRVADFGRAVSGAHAVTGRGGEVVRDAVEDQPACVDEDRIRTGGRRLSSTSACLMTM